MMTISPECTEQNVAQNSDLIDMDDDDLNPFLAPPPPQVATDITPPLPPRQGTWQHNNLPSAPSLSAFASQEGTRMRPVSRGNPFAETASTTHNPRQSTETGGRSPSSSYPVVQSPRRSNAVLGGTTAADWTNHPTPQLPQLTRELSPAPDDLPAAPPTPPRLRDQTTLSRGRSESPRGTRRDAQSLQHHNRRPSASSPHRNNNAGAIPAASANAASGRGACVPSSAGSCSVGSRPSSPVGKSRRRPSSNSGGTTSNSSSGRTPRPSVSPVPRGPPPATPPRTTTNSSGAPAAAAAAVAAMAASTAPTALSGGGGSAPAPPAQGRRESQTSQWNWQNIGRSLFSAMMGNAFSGEQEQSRGETKGPEKRRARSMRELTPHVMQQTPEGKFSVSVWRKNKQDPKPVQVSVGLYNSAYEGQRAAEAFSPPVWQEPKKNSKCATCNCSFGFLTRRRHHCRNCGRLVCSVCAETFWPRSMLPPTYNVDTTEKKVRVCGTCNGAGERFRRALLLGSEEEALAAYSTGCVNLRTPYTIYHNELPVHCAAAGGNLNILAWLVEDRCCPLFLDRERKVALGDSRKMSVMGAAAASGNIQIMRYLAFTQGCKVTEIRDMHTLWQAMEKCLYEGADVPSTATTFHLSRRSGSAGASASGGAYAVGGSHAGAGGASGAEVAPTVGDEDNSCIVCFDSKVDCTLVPCGHHCCCLTCAAQFELCPVCRRPVQQKIKAISV